jgi:hypothetical protein
VGLRVVLAGIHHLDAVKEVRVQDLGVLRIPPCHPVGLLAGPARVVPEDERALPAGRAQGLAPVLRVEGGRRLQEDGVEVPGRHLPRDLGPLYDQEVQLLPVRGRDLVRALVVRGEVVLVGLVLDVVGDGDRVEALPPRLLGAHVGPDVAVREDGVGVEVALQGPEARDVGHAQGPPHADVVGGAFCRRQEGQRENDTSR